MQITFRNKSKELKKEDHTHAVLSIFFDGTEGGSEDNKFLKSLQLTKLNNLPNNNKYKVNRSVDFNDFLKSIDHSKFWYYSGSLTIPPCTEGYRWIIVKDVQNIGKDQLQMFTSLYENNSGVYMNGNRRNIQDLNDRPLYFIDSALAYATALVTGFAAALSLQALI